MTSEVKFSQYYEETVGRFLEETAYEKQPLFENSVKNAVETIFFSNFLKKDEDDDNLDM